jgi:hypothetical protein
MSLMLFTEYRDPPPLRTIDLPADNHAIFQDGVFEQPGVEALAQEAVVMFRGHFDQYLHGPNGMSESTKIQGRKYDDLVKFGSPKGH